MFYVRVFSVLVIFSRELFEATPPPPPPTPG